MGLPGSCRLQGCGYKMHSRRSRSRQRLRPYTTALCALLYIQVKDGLEKAELVASWNKRKQKRAHRALSSTAWRADREKRTASL
jgi:hypothetical protein